MATVRGAEHVRAEFLASAEVKTQVAQAIAGPAVEIAHLVAVALGGGNKVMVFGNGGSAADSQHFAGEMTGRFKAPGRAPLPMMALSADSIALTCIANDFSYEEVFSRQVEAFAQPGDVVIGISTSGQSANVLRALQAGKAKGATTVALAGRDGGPVALEADVALVVPVRDTTRIQECHITAIHAICDLIEDEYLASVEK